MQTSRCFVSALVMSVLLVGCGDTVAQTTQPDMGHVTVAHPDLLAPPDLDPAPAADMGPPADFAEVPIADMTTACIGREPDSGMCQIPDGATYMPKYDMSPCPCGIAQ